MLCLGSGPGVCVDHLTIMYVYALRVFTELQNPEQNFYLVFWFLSDHRSNRTFKIYNYHWKKILTWSKNDHEYCLYACMHSPVFTIWYIDKTFLTVCMVKLSNNIMQIFFWSQVWFTKQAIKNHISMNFIARKWKGSFKIQNIIK